MNRKTMVHVGAAVLLTTVTLAQAQYGSSPKAAKVLKFSTMVGVNGAFLSPNEVRGVLGDDLPWIARSVKGQLLSNGRLTIKIRGLVFPSLPEVPPELQGINDEPLFQAMVSCLTDDGQGGLVTTNQTTAGFPATSSGNADINATLSLPAPCAAPIVFVTGGSGKWFAMTGVRTAGP